MKKAELMEMSLNEVKKIANDVGAKYHHANKHEKIADAILAKLAEGDDLPDAVEAEDDDLPEVHEDAAPEPVAPVKAIQTGSLPDPENRKFLEMCTPANVRSSLNQHLNRGLEIITLTDEYFHIRCQNREAAGNMKQPLKQIINQANILLRPTKAPTEE